MKPGKDKKQHIIASITATRSPVRQAYDQQGHKPSIAEMQRNGTPGLAMAGHVAYMVVTSPIGINTSAQGIIDQFSNNHPDMFERLSSVAI